jgi:hypothetical protein
MDDAGDALHVGGDVDPQAAPRSVRVARDAAVLTPLLLLVQGAVLIVAHADRRAVAQAHLPLGAVVDVAVEVVNAERTARFKVVLLEIRAPSHDRYDTG